MGRKKFKEALLQKRTEVENQSSEANKSRFQEPSVEEQIEKAKENIVDSLDIPKRFKNKGFRNFDYTKLKNDNPKLIYEDIINYSKNFIELMNKNNWLVLSGGYGLGKTHLAVAVFRECAKQYAEFRVKKGFDTWYNSDPTIGRGFIFKTSSTMIQEIRDCYDSDQVNERETMMKFKNCKLLLLDDLGTERASEWQQEKLHLILNHRYNQMLPTIITTNLDTAELDNQVTPRLVERMLEAAGNGKYLFRLEGESNRGEDSN